MNAEVRLQMHDPTAGAGGFGRVYKTLTKGGQLVAVKVLFENKSLAKRALELSVREAWTWSQLDHPNVVPFLGIANYSEICVGALPQLCLISPWMNQGNVMDYIGRYPSEDRIPFMRDASEGLLYLHSLRPSPVIHGDIRGSNILVERSGEYVVARLADFGLAHVMESLEEHGHSTTSTTALGNIRWMAFERVFPQKYSLGGARDSKTPASDVFELMRTFFEIITGKRPFHGLNDMEVFSLIHTSNNPQGPEVGCILDEDAEGIWLWDFMQQCWSENRSERPSADAVQKFVESVKYFPELLDLSILMRSEPWFDLKKLRRSARHFRYLRFEFTHAMQGEIANMQDIFHSLPRSPWKGLTLRTIEPEDMERAWSHFDSTQSGPASQLESLRLEITSPPAFWDMTHQISATSVENLAPSLRQLFLIYTPLRWQGLIRWHLEELLLLSGASCLGM